MKIGYARVSTTDQKLEPQIERLKAAGCEKIFSEMFSGKAKEDRKELNLCLEFVRKGDTLVLIKIDRLARNVCDLLNICKKLKKKEVELIFLDNNIDTSTPAGACMLTMLGAFAEFERSMINERSVAGIKRCLELGKKTGRPCKKGGIKIIDPKEIKRMYEEEKKTIKELTVQFGCSRQTIYNYLKDKIPKVNSFINR